MGDPLLHTYVTEHLDDPSAEASAYCMTTVSRKLLTPVELAAAVGQKTPDAVRRTRYHGLDFPAVSDNAIDAVREVMARYAHCARCHLADRRTSVVHLKGDPMSPVALLGEGPGWTEDAHGTPFVGPSGKLQDKLLEGVGIVPLSLAWFNLAGCRPHDHRHAPDRPPTIVEKIACSERLLMMFRAIRPSVVICLGAEATALFFDEPPHPWTWHTTPEGVVVGHARHPAYLLRRIAVQGGEAERVAAVRFFTVLKDRLPYLTKLPVWPLPVRYLGELSDPARVMVGK